MPSRRSHGARPPAPPRVITIPPARPAEMPQALHPAGPDPEDPDTRVDLADAELRRIRTITRWLDDRYLDPVIGFLLPGFGDVVPLTFGLYVLVTAARRRVPPVVLARMILNVGIDTLVGVVPILGDLFDVAFKAHRRNAELLMQRHGQRHGTMGDWLLVGGALLFLLGVLAVPIVLVIWTASGIRDRIAS